MRHDGDKQQLRVLSVNGQFVLKLAVGDLFTFTRVTGFPAVKIPSYFQGEKIRIPMSLFYVSPVVTLASEGV